MKSFDAWQEVKSRCSKMERHYTSLLEDFEVEEIHQFRLNLKKLGALFELINAECQSKRKLKIGKKLHAFYEAVGELRNLQLHREVVLDLGNQLGFETPGSYFQILKGRENEVKQHIRSMALQGVLHKTCHKIMGRVPQQLGNEAVENFVSNNKYQLLKILLDKTYPDENLHRIRKLLKRFLYLWSWVEKEIISQPHSACLNKETCLDLSEKLGDFQDQCITLHYVETFRSNEMLSSDDQTILTIISLHIQEKKQKMKIKLLSELRKCMHETWETNVLLPIYEYL